MLERLAIGETLTKTALLADDDYLISNFPYEARQNAPFIAYGQVVAPYSEKFQVADGSERHYGKLNFTFTFNIMDDELFEYLWITKAAYNPSPLVTIGVINRLYPGSDKYVAINARLRFPDLTDEGLKPVNNRWFDNPVFTIFNGEYAAP